MEQTSSTSPPPPPTREPELAEELRELGSSLAALGRSAFKGGRVLSSELLRSVRGIVDKARDEIDRLTGEKK